MGKGGRIMKSSELQSANSIIEAANIEITNSSQLVKANSTLGLIKESIKQIQFFFKSIKQEHDNAKKMILKKEKEALRRLPEAESLLKSKILDYIKANKDKELPKLEGLSIKESWGYEIIDAKLIPSEYLMPNERKISKVVSALGRETQIKGVKICKKITIAKRSE